VPTFLHGFVQLVTAYSGPRGEFECAVLLARDEGGAHVTCLYDDPEYVAMVREAYDSAESARSECANEDEKHKLYAFDRIDIVPDVVLRGWPTEWEEAAQPGGAD
jgi:hypothetical protein